MGDNAWNTSAPRGRGGAGGRGAGQAGVGAQQAGGQGSQFHQLQLPPGWQIAYTPDHQVYFVDHNTRTTHWQLPAQYQNQPNANSFAPRGGRGGRGRGGSADGAAGRVGIDSTKRKTKMCMNFENGSCAWGDRCAFAHGAHELMAGQQGSQQQGGAPQQQGDNQQAAAATQ